MRQTRTHIHIHTLVHMHTHSISRFPWLSSATPVHMGTQGDRDDVSEEFQLVRPIPLTLSESTMTSIYRMGEGGRRAGEGPRGQGHAPMAK